jgi:ribonucleoside-diphosphate reductase alpha chain
MASGTASADEVLLTANALTVLERRYLKKDTTGQPTETPAEMFRRVAHNIASAEANYGASPERLREVEDAFYGMMTRLEFLPNSPTLMNAGRHFQQLSACFVIPVGDSMEQIFEAVKHTALIHKSGGGTGFSFSRLRPKHDIVSSTTGISSGPVSFMKVFDAATEAIKQGGTRRGANMGILRVDHPDILEFIDCKQDLSVLTNFNISVALTEKFMRAVADDATYELVNPRNGHAVESLRAREVWERIVHAAWATGEPGIIFLDRINAANPTPAVGEMEATNPCGEQPLLPYESCNLGSINLAKLIRGEPLSGTLDREKLAQVVRMSVRFLDNVIEMNAFPLPEIEQMTKANRKIGLGVMGFADLLIHMGVPYNSARAEAIAEETMCFIREEARKASEELAEERGVFPNWEESIFGPRGLNRKQRNSTTTTIAPTGTISMIAGASSGVEPLFAVAYSKHVLGGESLAEINPLFEEIMRERGLLTPELLQKVVAHGTIQEMPEIPGDLREVFVTAHDISPEAHVRIQAAFQKCTDNAVSKTVNFPEDATEEEVGEVYRLAYELGCKGVTIYRNLSRQEQVLRMGAAEAKPQPAAAGAEPRSRPTVVHGTTVEMKTGCGKLYLTINSDDRGPFEVFGNMGKAGGCVASQTEAVARLISLAFRVGVKPEHVIKQLKGISCHMPAWEKGGGKILSCADAFAKAVERIVFPEAEQLAMDFNGRSFGHLGACPECGGALYAESGCITCHDCGYSQCD